MEVTENEARDARIILVAFFGQSAENWSINDRVIELIGEMLTKNRKCAEVMGLVPRPGLVDKNYIKGNFATWPGGSSAAKNHTEYVSCS